MISGWNMSNPPPGRQHPWTVSVKNPDWHYVDFKMHPELIRTSLEDLKDLEGFPAVESFYQLIERLNGDDCLIETNDLGLLPPKLSESRQYPHRMTVYGRLALLFRNLDLNTNRDTVFEIGSRLMDRMVDTCADLPVALEVSLWPHYFLEIARNGDVLHLAFWAWGDDENEAMHNLDQFLTRLCGVVLELNPEIARLCAMANKLMRD